MVERERKIRKLEEKSNAVADDVSILFITGLYAVLF